MKHFHNIFYMGKVLTLLFVLCIILSWNCTYDKGQYLPNIPPVTRLSNVPPPEDTITTPNPRLTLHWVGDDPDGYVVGFRYRWTFQQGGRDTVHPYNIILNITLTQGFALMVNTDNPLLVPAVYKYFANLPPDGLDASRSDSLAKGDSITVEGIKIYASNPDSVRAQNTGRRIKYSFPVHENPNSGTFIFDSQPASPSFHTFEVSAIDNLGAVSLRPALVSFITPSVSPPKTEIIALYPPDTSIVIGRFTESFNGIPFHFQGTDPNSRTIEYRWVVDKDLWLAKTGTIPWSTFNPSQYAYVTAADFPDTLATTHTFYVQSKNEFNSIDTIGWFLRKRFDSNGRWTGFYDTVRASWNFNTIYPKFRQPGYTQKILLINAGNDDRRGTSAHPSRQMVNDYYRSILNDLGKPDSIISIFGVSRSGPGSTGFPTLAEISQYSLVIFAGDITNDYFILPQDFSLDVARERVLQSYCYVGGKLILSGWQLRSDINMRQQEEYYRNIPHLDRIRGGESSMGDTASFIGAKGELGYPNIAIDSTKLDPEWLGALPYTPLSYPVGFGEIIQKFHGKYPGFYLGPYQFLRTEDEPISIRYLGITFDVIFFGCPLYYMERQGVVETLHKALIDIKE